MLKLTYGQIQKQVMFSFLHVLQQCTQQFLQTTAYLDILLHLRNRFHRTDPCVRLAVRILNHRRLVQKDLSKRTSFTLAFFKSSISSSEKILFLARNSRRGPSTTSCNSFRSTHTSCKWSLSSRRHNAVFSSNKMLTKQRRMSTLGVPSNHKYWV